MNDDIEDCYKGYENKVREIKSELALQHENVDYLEEKLKSHLK